MLTKLLCCAIIAVTFARAKLKAQGPNVCITEECKKLAENLAETMDTSVDPCDNFYNYACGKWVAEKYIPPDYATWSQTEVIARSMKTRLKGLLRTKSKSSDLLPIKQAKKWYQQCMNTGDYNEFFGYRLFIYVDLISGIYEIERIEKRGIEPIQSILREIGGWPIVMNANDWNDTEFSWPTVNRYFAVMTGDYYLWKIVADYADANGDYELGTINLDVPSWPLVNVLPRAVGGNFFFRWRKYALLILDVVDAFAKHNGVTIPMDRLMAESAEIGAFEIHLFHLAQRNKTGSWVKFKELPSMAENKLTKSNSDRPGFTLNYSSLVQDLFDTADIKVHPDTWVYVNNDGYYRGFDALLKATPQRIIVNYLHWRFVEATIQYTNEEMRDIVFQRTLKKEFGVEETTPRWYQCVDEIKLRHAVSYLYVKTYFKNSTRISGKRMIDNIHSALLDQINGSKWMDEKSKAMTKEKFNAMKEFLAFPNWYYDNHTVLIELYKGLKIENEYFETVLNFIKYKNRRKLINYITPEPSFTGDEEPHSPLSFDAYYYSLVNSAVYPEAIFERPSFGSHYILAVNYARAGAIVGHEVGHSFDDSNICYGKAGELTLLPKAILQAYYKRADCFVEQFNKYYPYTYVTDKTDWACGAMHGNNNSGHATVKFTRSQLTVGENIADTTGLQAAYLAFKKSRKTKYPRAKTRLPGFEHVTSSQLFFLSFASAHCQAIRPERKAFLRGIVLTHSTPEMRVLGSVSNTVGFAKAFKCPAGTPMNPKKKCSIWDQPGFN